MWVRSVTLSVSMPFQSARVLPTSQPTLRPLYRRILHADVLPVRRNPLHERRCVFGVDTLLCMSCFVYRRTWSLEHASMPPVILVSARSSEMRTRKEGELAMGFRFSVGSSHLHALIVSSEFSDPARRLSPRAIIPSSAPYSHSLYHAEHYFTSHHLAIPT